MSMSEEVTHTEIVHVEHRKNKLYTFTLVKKKDDQRYALLASEGGRVTHTKNEGGGWNMREHIYWYRNTGALLAIVNRELTDSHDEHYISMLRYIRKEFT
jgi:hypothetical protein